MSKGKYRRTAQDSGPRAASAQGLCSLSPESYGLGRLEFLMLRILVTGGTFDKRYDEIRGLLSFGDTQVPEMLRLGRSRVSVTVETVMMVDSLEMNAAHRMKVADRCRHSPETRIVVTHGTDTMVETAAVLADSVSDKTIVLTGAMIPYAFGSSDGLFNLGSAVAFAQVLPAGVFIAMNGRCFPWNRVRKNREDGIFEEQDV
jgi:L-asparaginase